MELERQVVSLELAKELKKAGHEQEGLWFWITFPKDKRRKPELGSPRYCHCNYVIEKIRNEVIYAPTVAEGLNRLPARLIFNTHKGEKSYYLTIERIGNTWCIHYRYNYACRDYEHLCTEEGNKLADVIHKMWLYLKKENSL